LKFIRLLLSEKNEISAVRAMAIYSLIIGSGIAIYGIVSNKDLGGVSELVAVFVGGGFAGKVGQKIIETQK